METQTTSTFVAGVLQGDTLVSIPLYHLFRLHALEHLLIKSKKIVSS